LRSKFQSHIAAQKSRFWLAILVFTSTLLLHGCSSVAPKKHKTIEGPVGYIEFYYPKIYQRFGLTPKIHSIINNRIQFEGSISSFDDSGYGEFRISKPPGNYDFAVSLGNAFTEIRGVEIDEDILLPIRISLQNIRTSFEPHMSASNSGSFSTSLQTSFQMKLIKEKNISSR